MIVKILSKEQFKKINQNFRITKMIFKMLFKYSITVVQMEKFKKIYVNYRY